MKTMLVALLALVVGFIAGLVLTQILAVIGLALFERPTWLRVLRYVPFLTALLGGVAAPLVLRRKRV